MHVRLLVACGLLKGVFGSGTTWNGMESFRSKGTEWFHPRVRFGKKGGTEWYHILFGWRNWRAERNVVKLNFYLKIVINNGKWSF